MEKEQMLILSTAHLPESEIPLANKFAAYQDEYSWVLKVPPEPYFVKPPEGSRLRELAKLANKEGCRWLVLDRDATTREGLETFEW